MEYSSPLWASRESSFLIWFLFVCLLFRFENMGEVEWHIKVKEIASQHNGSWEETGGKRWHYSNQSEKLFWRLFPPFIRTLVGHAWGYETSDEVPHRYNVTSPTAALAQPAGLWIIMRRWQCLKHRLYRWQAQPQAKAHPQRKAHTHTKNKHRRQTGL